MNVPLQLAEMGLDIYRDYQRALAYRSAVDFDDLIRLALGALENDEEYLARLRLRWPYILEDEAQDSSRLQEQILGLLAGPQGSWVRVGDPNQAIYETFTTADPRYLREFMRDDEVQALSLPNSGRSSRSIIDLANYLVEWTQTEHPEEGVRDALEAPPWIEPTPQGDPQPNPEDQPDQIFLVRQGFTPEEEIAVVVDSIARWLPDHPDETVAVLTPRNTRGFAVTDALRTRGIEYEDGLLRSSSLTRFSAGALANLLNYLSDPASARKLATVFRVWRREDRDDEERAADIERAAGVLRRLSRVEDFLHPGPEGDWLDEFAEQDPEMAELLGEFRDLMHRWQASVQIPVDQMLLATAPDLLDEPAELAISHKLAFLLRMAAQQHPDWRLPQMTDELAQIARNQRRFIGFGEEESGFDPDNFKGKVVVATLHKAKGLEWDRVYLMSTNNYNYPSAQEYDTYIAERWFLRDNLNLGAESLAQLRQLVSEDAYEWYQEGAASLDARLDYVRERLRLLYVGITRSRKSLVVTWNSGKGRKPSRPALPFAALQEFWSMHGGREEMP